MRSHRQQPTRLPRPWDSPGKNTGVGCHFLLQCRKVKSESEVAQSCPTLSDPMNYSLPGSTVHGIFLARVLEWGAIAFSEGHNNRLLYFFEELSLVPFSCSVVRLFATPWSGAHQASLSITNFWSPPKPMSIKSVMPSNHLILCRPLLLLPSIFPSIRVFSNESALRIRWPKYWSFSFSISPSSKHLGLIYFKKNWLDLLVVQGTLKSLLQHHSSRASILWHSAFFTVQLSHPYITVQKHQFEELVG